MTRRSTSNGHSVKLRLAMRSSLAHSNSESLGALSEYFKSGSIITTSLEGFSDQVSILDATDAQAKNRAHGRLEDNVGA